MNPFYTFEFYVKILQSWIHDFGLITDITYPPKIKLTDARFGRVCVNTATQCEMLSFYGCLDSELL